MSQNSQSQKSPKRPQNQARLSVAEKKAIVVQVEEGVMQKTLREQYGVSTAAIRVWVNKYASEAYLACKQRRHELHEISPVVRAIREGRLTVKGAAIQCQVRVSTINSWIKRCEQQEATLLPPDPAPAAQAGETDTERQLRQELEAARWKIRALETLIEVAETELKIPIRKKPGAKQ